MSPVRHGSLCTGYGGLDMAVQALFGGELAWWSDIDDGAIAVMEHHHPDVPNVGDIKTADWSAVPRVDIVTAGYPCQPFSNAGLRKGTDDPRHLWPWIARALGVLRPRFVVLENVSAHLRRGFPVVLADLAALGYDARWTTFRASDVGAAHRRERLFVIAANTARVNQWPRFRNAGPARGQRDNRRNQSDNRRGATPPDSASVGRREGRAEHARVVGRPDVAQRGEQAPPDAHRGQRDRREQAPERGTLGRASPTGRGGQATSDARGDSVREQQGRRGGSRGQGPSVAGRHRQAPSDTHRAGLQGTQPARGRDVSTRGDLKTVADANGDRRARRPERDGGPVRSGQPAPLGRDADRRDVQAGEVDWQEYEPAIRRWELEIGRPAPAPSARGPRGGVKVAPAFGEWLMGLPPGWITDVAGLSIDTQLKLIGNGVVPQQAVAALWFLLASGSEVATHGT